MWSTCARDSCGFNTAFVSCGSCSPDSLDVLYFAHLLKVKSCHPKVGRDIDNPILGNSKT